MLGMAASFGADPVRFSALHGSAVSAALRDKNRRQGLGRERAGGTGGASREPVT